MTSALHCAASLSGGDLRCKQLVLKVFVKDLFKQWNNKRLHRKPGANPVSVSGVMECMRGTGSAHSRRHMKNKCALARETLKKNAEFTFNLCK